MKLCSKYKTKLLMYHYGEKKQKRNGLCRFDRVMRDGHIRPGEEGGNGPPEGKFMKLGGKVNFGVLRSKIDVIRAKRRPAASF